MYLCSRVFHFSLPRAGTPLILCGSLIDILSFKLSHIVLLLQQRLRVEVQQFCVYLIIYLYVYLSISKPLICTHSVLYNHHTCLLVIFPSLPTFFIVTLTLTC